MVPGKRIKTKYTGIYIRSSTNRMREDGQPEIYYDLVYTIWDGRTRFKTAGKESEGMTLEEAWKIRTALVEEERRKRMEEKKHKPPSPKRKKTPYTGVYSRTYGDRLCLDGGPDICYDIHWFSRAEKKTKYKKIGWKSEGFTVENAVAIRAKLIQDERYPDGIPQLPDLVPNRSGEKTLQDVWERYQQIWLPNLKNKVKVKSNYNLYIKKAFGDHYLSEITVFEIDKFKQKLFKTEYLPGKTLSAGTVRAILSVLRRILRKSVEWDLHTKALPVIRLPKEEGVRERYLEPEEANMLLDCLQYISCQYYFIAKISLYTGMRLGEVLAINISDIDLKGKIIHVDGKTGKRPAYIADELLSDLAVLVKKSKALLFEPEPGKRIHQTKISNDFVSIMNELGFNDHTDDPKYKCVFHTLRHTFCSWLAIKGVPLYTIAKLVGHSSTRMTERYAKLSPDSKRSALIHIDDTLKKI